ncbi:MAG: FAD-dependent oxidoreductase [Acidimicrobiales bacterium]|nr:FAD-dependent oxidoreductase [Acidimicrobiales bacterium]MCB9392725.1 FAD-dependent oxidoreductase [Acidimicrobiaceae bacterium]
MHVSTRDHSSHPGPDGTDADLIVVGAGVAGLAAAMTAAATGRRTLVVDAHGVGGRGRTADHHGWSLNVGPHALYRRAALEQLLDRHGIVCAGGMPATDDAWLVRDGAAHPQRLSPGAIARTSLLGRRDRLRLLALLARVQRLDPERHVGRSLADWLREVPVPVRQFVEMFARVGTYTHAPEVLDAGAALRQVQLAVGPGVRYLDGGWATMLDAMASRVRSLGGEIRTGVEVSAVRSLAGGPGVEVHLAGGTVVLATGAVIATGGPDTASRLTGRPVVGVERLTPPVTASALDLCLTRAVPRVAFALDEPLYLSAHAPAARLAPAGGGLVSVLRYHAPGADPAPADIARGELRAFATTAGIVGRDVAHERYLHRVVVAHGAPTAAGGGLPGRPQVDCLGLPDVVVAGDWVGPTGLLADASAASGVEAAETVCRRLDERGTIAA